jgi:hypothetical protein
LKHNKAREIWLTIGTLNRYAQTVKVWLMPFVAKCRSCNHVLWANTKRFLRLLMKWHDSDSHKVYDSEDFDFCNWVILRVTHEQYKDINLASKNPAFWKAIRTNPKRL